MKFLTTDDLSRRWTCSIGHLANMRSIGEGPAYAKLGKRVLYPVDVIEAYEDARLVLMPA